MEKKLGEIIEQRLISLGIQKVKMYRDLGISSSNTCSFFKGRRGVKYDVLIAMLKYLGLTFGKETENTSDVELNHIPEFIKSCFKEKYNNIKDIDLPVHYCTLISFTSGYRKVTSLTLEKLLPVIGVTILPYKKEV